MCVQLFLPPPVSQTRDADIHVITRWKANNPDSAHISVSMRINQSNVRLPKSTQRLHVHFNEVAVENFDWCKRHQLSNSVFFHVFEFQHEFEFQRITNETDTCAGAHAYAASVEWTKVCLHMNWLPTALNWFCIWASHGVCFSSTFFSFFHLIVCVSRYNEQIHKHTHAIPFSTSCQLWNVFCSGSMMWCAAEKKES